MSGSWKSFGWQFITALVLGLGVAMGILMLLEPRQGPPVPFLFAMSVGGVLAPVVPALLSGWKGWAMKPLLLANLTAAWVYSDNAGVGVLSVVIASLCFLGAQKARAVVFYYSAPAVAGAGADAPQAGEPPAETK